MIANIIRDYDYLISALTKIVEPMVPVEVNETMEITNVISLNSKSVRFTVTVRGQGRDEDLGFTIPDAVIVRAIADLKEDEL